FRFLVLESLTDVFEDLEPLRALGLQAVEALQVPGRDDGRHGDAALFDDHPRLAAEHLVEQLTPLLPGFGDIDGLGQRFTLSHAASFPGARSVRSSIEPYVSHEGKKDE